MAIERPALLVDKSAWVRGAAARFVDEAELCLCWITRTEILYSARPGADFERIETDLSAFRDLRIGSATLDAASAAQRSAAADGQHRIPLPDLLVAACAQEHSVGVLHVDRHFDVLANYLEFEPVRAADLESPPE